MLPFSPQKGAPTIVAIAAIPPEIELQLHDTLASASRLWVRGRVAIAHVPLATVAGWWDRWWRQPVVAGELPHLAVQTRILGETLEQEVPLRRDGSFEALFQVGAPAPQRGWRVARHQVCLGGQAVRGCGVVLTPSPSAKTAVVVILPARCTQGEGPSQFTHAAEAARAAPVLRELQREQPDTPFYYLAANEKAGTDTQAELALAAASLGWPHGQVVLLSSAPRREAAAVVQGLDRLRWLFADELTLLVLSLEPSVDRFLPGVLRQVPGRATVRRFVTSATDPSEALDASARKFPLVSTASRSVVAGGVPRYPVVFCHGMLGMSFLRRSIPEDPNYFVHLRTFLRERGIEALFPGVEPTGGVAERAEQLRDQVRRWTDEPVNLVAHSMGGLDCRYLITRLGFAPRVGSLTTVAAPHRGSSLADWFVLNYRDRVPLLHGLEALGVNVRGFLDCRPAACLTFNDQVPNVGNVRYFSYGGSVTLDRVSPLLRRSWNWLTPREGPNDGLVSVQSACWGEYLGTLAVDHFGQTPDGLFTHPGEDFDAVGFFSRLVEDLARYGM